MKTKILQSLISISVIALLAVGMSSCDLIRMKRKNQEGENSRKAVAKVNQIFLYEDELKGIVPEKTTKDDSAARINAYVNSWVRKQLLIQEALKTISIDEAEVE